MTLVEKNTCTLAYVLHRRPENILESFTYLKNIFHSTGALHGKFTENVLIAHTFYSSKVEYYIIVYVRRQNSEERGQTLT